MLQLVIVASVAVVALVVGWWMQRQAPDAPSTPQVHEVPSQLDREDFVRPDAPWLTVVFTSATCATCAKVWGAAELLESNDVAVQNVEVSAEAALHERYGISAVPLVVIADHEGVTRGSFVGPPSNADLWAKLAELREPAE